MKILLLILTAFGWGLFTVEAEVPLWLNIFVSGMLGWYWTRIYAFLFGGKR